MDKVYTVFDDGSGSETQEIITFNYDDLKRMTVIVDSARAGSAFFLFSRTTAFYNNIDTLPYKITSISGDSNNSDTVIMFHYYNSAHIKTKDSVITSTLEISSGSYQKDIKVTNYSYTPGKMYGYSVQTAIYPVSAAVVTKDTATLDGNNNIISNKKYKVSGSVSELSIISNFTYDNHANPYSKLNIFTALHQLPDPNQLNEASYNNFLTEDHHVLLPSPYDENIIISYSYQQNGLPTVANEIWNGIVSKTITPTKIYDT